MKVLKIVGTILILCAVIFLSISCGSNSSSTSTTTTKTATVQKGNLSVSITGTGNLAYSTTEDLAFEVPGYVESVSVKAGDTVEKDQEIAKVDTSEWEKTLKGYQTALNTAQRALSTAQDTLATDERKVSAAELDISQAQLDLQTAQYNLSQIADVKTAQDAADSAQNSLEVAQANLQVALAQGSANTDYLNNQVAYFNKILDQTKQKLQNILEGKNLNITTSVALQVAQDQLAINQKQRSVEDAQAAVDTAKTAISNAQLDVADDQQSVKDAQDNLDEANSLSPIIKAPFAGIITEVDVNGGGEVFKGTVAAKIADPSQFEADIYVTENDIFSVTVGGEATVSLDALSDLTYPAKVTYIAPTATVSSGVVNYSVTVTLTSLTPISTSQSSSQPATGAMPSGTPPSGAQIMGTPPAGGIPSGTPPAMLSQGTANTTPTPTGTSTTVSSATSTSSSVSQSITLKKGLSATVEIISQHADNVLIIPSKAIKQLGQNYTVQVVKGTATETRIVKTGMTDGTNTAITDGLSEGEQVVYSISTSGSLSTTKTTTQQSVPGLGVGGPPGGGF